MRGAKATVHLTEVRMVSCATALAHALQLALNAPFMCQPETAPGLLPEGTFVIDSLDTVLLCLKRHPGNAELHQIADTMTRYAEFETMIRIVGGLLGAYDLTCNSKLLGAAARVVDTLESAFAYGDIPAPMVDLKLKRPAASPWFPPHCTTVADAGTIVFELLWLAERTKSIKYSDRAMSIVNALGKDTFVAYQPGAPCAQSGVFQTGVGADSWFEVLLKLKLRPELTEAFLTTVDWPRLNPSHLECMWPVYAPNAKRAREQCVAWATSQCHRYPETAEMLYLTGDTETLERAKHAFLKECRTQMGYGPDSWIVAETIKYLFGLPPENATFSTEAHARLDAPTCGCA